MVGGFAACGFTHAGVVTLDVAKVRTQAYGKAGKWPNGLLPSIRQIWKGEGFRGLTLGWSPTLWGYGAQGLFKFGLNEFFKDFYTKLVGEETLQSSTVTKMALWAAASGSAEVFADVALCPFEMTKVRMQVALPGQAVGFPHKILPALREMSASSAETKFPFGSLYPLWGRQVPYTMVSTNESSEIPVPRCSGKVGIKLTSVPRLIDQVCWFLSNTRVCLRADRKAIRKDEERFQRNHAARHHLCLWILGWHLLCDCNAANGQLGIHEGYRGKQEQELGPDGVGYGDP